MHVVYNKSTYTVVSKLLLLLQVGFIQKNIKLSTHWYITYYNILHILAVHMANLWLEDIFKCSITKIIAVKFRKRGKYF